MKASSSRFPVVEKIVGEEFFAAMARALRASIRRVRRCLSGYGDEFPAFVAAFEPAREFAYLADVARLEAARTRAFHAADACRSIRPGSPRSIRQRLPAPSGRFASLGRNRSFPASGRHHLGDEQRRADPAPIELGTARMHWWFARSWMWKSGRCRRAVRRFCWRWPTAGRSAMPRRPHSPTIPDFDLARSLADLMSGIATGIATAPEHNGDGAA